MYYIEQHHITKETINYLLGVRLEGYSIEDKGKLSFNVFIYNVQDGIEINYLTGESKKIEDWLEDGR